LSNHSLYIYSKSISDLQVCSTIVIHKIVIKKVENPSFALYLSKEKVAGTIFIEKLDFKTLSVPPSWHRYLANWKNNIYLTLQNKMSTKTFALFSSIFLGNRANVKKEMDYAKEPFKIWGTSHYLARSGLHLVIFVLVWQFLLSLIPIVFWIKQIILISLISTYSLFSWSSVSFERALLMFLIYKFCIISGKPSHYVHLIILVTGIVLILNPLQLFFLDFQLSFGLTFALAWFNHMQTHKKHISA
jgi:ComEC/Rec2-related protein